MKVYHVLFSIFQNLMMTQKIGTTVSITTHLEQPSISKEWLNLCVCSHSKQLEGMLALRKMRVRVCEGCLNIFIGHFVAGSAVETPQWRSVCAWGWTGIPPSEHPAKSFHQPFLRQNQICWRRHQQCQCSFSLPHSHLAYSSKMSYSYLESWFYTICTWCKFQESTVNLRNPSCSDALHRFSTASTSWTRVE